VGGADLVRRKNNFVRFTGILHQDRDCLETNLPEKKFARAAKEGMALDSNLLEPTTYSD
jgi:hypothetical protein